MMWLVHHAHGVFFASCMHVRACFQARVTHLHQQLWPTTAQCNRHCGGSKHVMAVECVVQLPAGGSLQIHVCIQIVAVYGYARSHGSPHEQGLLAKCRGWELTSFVISIALCCAGLGWAVLHCAVPMICFADLCNCKRVDNKASNCSKQHGASHWQLMQAPPAVVVPLGLSKPWTR